MLPQAIAIAELVALTFLRSITQSCGNLIHCSYATNSKHSIISQILSISYKKYAGTKLKFGLGIIIVKVPLLLLVVVIQILSGVVPLTEMAGFTPIPSAIVCTLSLHLSHLRASSFFKPIFSVSSSTCYFQVFFGHSCFLLPLASRFRATLKTLSSSLLSTCPYHLTPFAVANWSIVTFNPNMSICFSVIFLSTTF